MSDYQKDVNIFNILGEDIGGEDSLSEYSTEIREVCDGIDDSIMDILISTQDEATHENTCREITRLEMYSKKKEHPYLNIGMTDARIKINSHKFKDKRNRIDQISTNGIRRKVNQSGNSKNQFERSSQLSLPHSKLYMLITLDLYNIYGIFSDDKYAEKLINATYDEDKDKILELKKDYRFNSYNRVLSKYTDHLWVGLDYSGYELETLHSKMSEIQTELQLDVNKGDLFKAIYVLYSNLNSLDVTLNHFELNDVFSKYIKKSLTTEQARFVVSTLFDKPKANKFEFLTSNDQFSHLLVDNRKNRSLLRYALKGIANNFSFYNNKAHDIKDGYLRFCESFNLNNDIFTGDLDADCDRALNGDLIMQISTFLESAEYLESYNDWNFVSICSYILRHMEAQNQLPEFYDEQTKLEEIRNEIIDRIKSHEGIEMIELSENRFGSKIKYGHTTQPLIFDLAKPKSKLSAVEKILRGSKNIDDAFRCRVGIPYELKLSDEARIPDFCYAATVAITEKLGGYSRNIRKIKAPLLHDEPNLNKFSQSIKTYKFIVDIIVQGKLVPIEVMMVLFYPEDHSSYKEKQCISTRNQLGLIPASQEINKAIEYLYWKYAFIDELSEIDTKRFLSVIRTISLEQDEKILCDIEKCSMLYELVMKFKSYLEDQSIIIILDRYKKINDYQSVIADIQNLHRKYKDSKHQIGEEDFKTIMSIIEYLHTEKQQITDEYNLNKLLELVMKIPEDVQDYWLDLLNERVEDTVSQFR